MGWRRGRHRRSRLLSAARGDRRGARLRRGRANSVFPAHRYQNERCIAAPVCYTAHNATQTFLMSAAATASLPARFAPRAMAQGVVPQGTPPAAPPLDSGAPADVSADKLGRISIMTFNFTPRLGFRRCAPNPNRVAGSVSISRSITRIPMACITWNCSTRIFASTDTVLPATIFGAH